MAVTAEECNIGEYIQGGLLEKHAVAIRNFETFQ
jgi:hypothetical protein